MQNTAEQMMAAAIDAVRQRVIAEMAAQQPKSAPQRRLLTAAQAGEYIGRTEAAVRQMIHKKQLPVVRDGRNVRIDIRVLDARIADLTL